MTPETVECLERVLRHGIGILRAVEDWLRKQREALGMPPTHAQQPPPHRRP